MISKLPTPHHLKDPHKLHRIDLCGYGKCNITESDFSVIDFSVYQNFGYSNSFKPDKETKDRFDLIKIALKY